MKGRPTAPRQGAGQAIADAVGLARHTAARLSEFSGCRPQTRGVTGPIHFALIDRVSSPMPIVGAALVRSYPPKRQRTFSRIRLRQASPNNSPQDGANTLERQWIVGSFRHAQQHEVNRVREAVPEVQAHGI